MSEAGLEETLPRFGDRASITRHILSFRVKSDFGPNAVFGLQPLTNLTRQYR